MPCPAALVRREVAREAETACRKLALCRNVRNAKPSEEIQAVRDRPDQQCVQGSRPDGPLEAFVTGGRRSYIALQSEAAEIDVAELERKVRIDAKADQGTSEGGRSGRLEARSSGPGDREGAV